ncbi:hypothetical protein [Inhella sp.]|uniref:hypothetical protein n=1 Tax=Inhella sp. TaxID=1921806 RepID=UPI0035B2ADDE
MAGTELLTGRAQASELIRQATGQAGLPLVGGTALWRLLSYKSAAAFRRSVERGTVPVTTFELPGRRGRFAVAGEVERWLAEIIAANTGKPNEQLK